MIRNGYHSRNFAKTNFYILKSVDRSIKEFFQEPESGMLLVACKEIPVIKENSVWVGEGNKNEISHAWSQVCRTASQAFSFHLKR